MVTLTPQERERELIRLMVNDYSKLVAIYRTAFAIVGPLKERTTSTQMIQEILDKEYPVEPRNNFAI
jgi:hypothetical protein